MEIRDIPGFPGYKATSDGQVIGKKGKPIGCFTSRYVICGMGFGNKSMCRHQLIALAFLPPKPFDNAEIDHIDRNKHNDAPENLRWVDRYDNMLNRDFYSNSETQVKGLFWEPVSQRWRCNYRRRGVLYQKWFHRTKQTEAIAWLNEIKNVGAE